MTSNATVRDIFNLRSIEIGYAKDGASEDTARALRAKYGSRARVSNIPVKDPATGLSSHLVVVHYPKPRRWTRGEQKLAHLLRR